MRIISFATAYNRLLHMISVVCILQIDYIVFVRRLFDAVR